MFNPLNFARSTDAIIAAADCQPTAEEMAELNAFHDAVDAQGPQPQPRKGLAGAAVMFMDTVPDIGATPW